MLGHRTLAFAIAAAGVPLFGGCAHEPPEAGYPAATAWMVPASDPWQPRPMAAAPRIQTLADPGPIAPVYDFAPRPRASEELRGVLPGGEACLDRLARTGTPFRLLDRAQGVHTPVAIDAPIGGVRYYTVARGPLVADCRLALALVMIAPELAALGISDMRYSGAWVYRLSRAGRLSLHAYGLAIDVHGFSAAGVHYEVSRDFVKGLSHGGCSGPLANAFVCRLRRTGLFHELLTPDDNADHHDHIHLGVSPLPEE